MIGLHLARQRPVGSSRRERWGLNGVVTVRWECQFEEQRQRIAREMKVGNRTECRQARHSPIRTVRCECDVVSLCERKTQCWAKTISSDFQIWRDLSVWRAATYRQEWRFVWSQISHRHVQHPAEPVRVIIEGSASVPRCPPPGKRNATYNVYRTELKVRPKGSSLIQSFAQGHRTPSLRSKVGYLFGMPGQ